VPSYSTYEAERVDERARQPSYLCLPDRKSQRLKAVGEGL